MGIRKSVRSVFPARQFVASLLAIFMVASVLTAGVFVSPAEAAVGNPDLTLGHVPGPSGNSVETGTAVFDGQGECGSGAPLAPPVPFPGNDCSPADNVVRTNDLVNYGYSVGVSNLLGASDPGGPEFIDDTYFTQTITPTSPDATISFDGLPPACRTGTNPDTGNPYDPQSQIVALAGGSSQLVCNTGRLSGPSQTIFLQTKVRVDGSSKNNSSFTSTDALCAGAPEDPPGTPAGGCTVVSDRDDVDGINDQDITPDHETYVSAAPQFDLAKNKYGPNGTGIITHPVTGELGYRYRFYPTIEVDPTADGKGSSPLDGVITFEDMMYVTGTTTPIPGFEMNPTGTDCYWNNHGGRPIPYGVITHGSNPDRNVADTGTVGCTQAAPGDPIQLTLTGTDTSGNHFPTYGSNGVTALQPPYYVAALYQYIWVPFEVIDRYDAAAVCDADDTAAGYTSPFCGEIDDTGNLPITNCLEAFDPDGLDADGNPVSNYGDGVEPGVYGAGDGNNNCRNTSMTLTNRGGSSKYYNTKVVDGGWVGGVPPGQTGYHTGDGPLEPNQNIAVASRFYNNGTFPFTSGALCEKVDNMTQTLVPIQTTAAWVPTDALGRNLPVEVHMTGGTYDPNLLVVEYASGPAGTPATGFVPWDNDHLVGGLNPLTGLYDGSTAVSQKATDCSDANGNWTTDPYSFDANEEASLQKIRSVRVSYLGTMEPNMDIRMGIELQMLNTFNQGPYDGQIIPAGVILPNFVAYKSDQLNSGDWRASTYNQNTDSGSTGDRMITSRGFVRIAKHLVPYNTHHSAVDPADYTNVQSGLSGDPFQFRLLPSVRSNVASGAPMTDVIVTDVLPSWLIFDPGCTAAVSAYPPPVVLANTPNPGETTLVWNLGTVVPNGTLDPIDFCVTSDQLAPDGTNALNTAVISANEDVSTENQRRSTATVVLNQIGEFRVQKSVDSALDPQDNSQLYTMEWFNSSDFVTLDAPIVIDVFPHLLDENGEGSAAPNSPGSDFSGTTTLSGAATSTTTGDFFYSKRDEFVVSNSPIHSSNPFSVAPYDITNPNLGPLPDANDDGESDAGLTIWCLATDFGTTGCPANFAEATSLLFVGDAEIDPGTGDSVSFNMNTSGNEPGDVYANNYAGFTPSLPGQVSVSNTVTVRVGGLALGDLVWFDWNDNGIYEPALGETPVPDGVTVELLDGGLVPLGPVTTTVNGRYFFDSLDPGTYAVRIPASEFAIGAPLEAMRPSTPVGTPDDDEDENTDQHGTVAGGDVVTAPVTLSWTTIGPDADGNVDIEGDEPVGDDNGSILIGYDDRLHNLTLDIGLVGDPDLAIVKKINGDDANAQPGLYLSAGDAITWTYEVENTGNTILSDVTIVDDQGVAVVCPALHTDPGGDNIIDALFVGDSLICSATGVATADGSYTNIGTATGTPPSGTEIEDTDPANYFGVDAAIVLEKATNTVDADNPNGPLISENGAVTWTFEVENTGNVALTDVTVTDNLVAAADISCATHRGDADGDNVIALMVPGDIVQCEATGTATSAQYANTGSVVGNPVTPAAPATGFDPDDPDTFPTDPADYTDAGIDDVADTDDSHYFGTDPSVLLEKSTNGVDADVPTGPIVAVGSTVTWVYQVTNDGNVPLLDVTVTDDVVASANISCAAHRGDADGDNVIALMLPGDVVDCEATAPATAGQYANTGSVSGDPVFPTAPGDYDPTDPNSWPTDPADYTATSDGPQTDTDPSHYFGSNPAVVIEKATNGIDADNPNGPLISENGAVTWTYEVENAGNTALMNVAVTDNVVAAADISCDAHRGDADGNNVIAVMLPGDVVECEATGTAVSGQYANTASVAGDPMYPTDPSAPGFDPDDPETWPTDPADYTDTGDEDPTDTDDSHYWGTDPSILLEKSTNGVDADTPTGPVVEVGSTVTWTYQITNDGTIPLLDVTVTDDVVAAANISCADHRGDIDGDNVIALMVPGDIVECEATGLATAGQYANTGSVVGDPVFPTAAGDYDSTDPSSWPTDPADYTDTGDVDPSDTDPSHYFGSTPAVVVEKATNTVDADNPNGPLISENGAVTWTYEVENTGNTALMNVAVTDNVVTAADISCATHRGDADGNNVIAMMLPGDVVECEATGTAVSGQYANTASVVGDPTYPADPSAPGFDPDDPETWPTDPADYVDTGDEDPTDTDDSHYWGTDPSVLLEKSTNTVDADIPTGPVVEVGSTVTWTYQVTNDGTIPLLDVTVTDDLVAAADISCADHRGDIDGNNVIAMMLPGDVVECEATAPATAGQYANTGSVSGDPVFPTNPGSYDPADPDTWPTDPADYTATADGPQTDTDPSHYFGSNPAVVIEKATNGADADSAPGPSVEVGDAITWTYEIENTGNTALVNVGVTDNLVAAVDISCDPHRGDVDANNVITLLLPGDIVECEASGLATAGQYENTGSTSGDPMYPTDPSAPGFDPDDPETWPTDPSGYGPTGDPAPEDTDDSHYIGAAPSVAIEKSTNGDDADVATGPYVPVAGNVTWVYEVRNDGNTVLLDVAVNDDQLAATDISCDTHRGDADGNNVIALMLPGDVVECTATGTATTGQYENNADVEGDPAMPDPATCGCDLADPTSWTSDDPGDYVDVPNTENPTAADPSHYYGTSSSLALEKATNGADADTPTGPNVLEGGVVTWTYTLENTGNTPLTGVEVTDDVVAAADISCVTHRGDADGNNVIALMLPGDVVECEATGVAIAGQYANTGTGEGQPAFPTSPGPDFDPTDPSTYPTDPGGYGPVVDPTTGLPVDTEEAEDPSHYFGSDAAAVVEKSTNGEDADEATGPWILEGDTVTWTYEITNPSNSALTNVTLTDDQVLATDIACETYLLDVDGDNVISLLLPGAVVTCTATAPATTIGQYENTATISGQPVFVTVPGPDFDQDDPSTWPTDPADYSVVVDPTTGLPVPPAEDTDPSHYWGGTSSIDLEKLVNGVDQDEAPGAQLDIGETATWSFVVTNTGSTPQTNVVVGDDDAAVTVDCGDGTNTISLLLPGAVVTCQGSSVVEAGSYVNVGSVTGQPSFPDTSDPAVDPTNPDTWPTDPTSYDPIVDPETGLPTGPDTDDDPSHHFGNGPAIELIKEVCVLDDGSTCDPANDDHWADEAIHHSSATEAWRITVENTGNVVLSDVEVVDPAIPACDTTIGTMAIGDIVVITCEGDPGNAPSSNTASVSATGPSGKEVVSSDTATLRPPPELKVVKTVADDTLAVGDAATFTLTVTNVGAGPATMTELVDQLPSGLTFVAVSSTAADTSYNPASKTLVWRIGDLAPGESATLSYTATVNVTSGSITNTAVVSSAEVEAVATLDDNTDTASVTVSAATPPSSVAFTGASSRSIATVAMLLVAAGVGLVLVARRRRFGLEG